MPLFPYRWAVIANGRALTDELANAPDDKFSFTFPTGKLVQTDYTVGPEILTDRFHVPIVRTNLSRNIGAIIEELRDEMLQAFRVSPLNDQTKKDKEVNVPALATVQQLIARITNRIFVGQPICQDEEFCRLNTVYVFDVVKAATKINMFPDFMHPRILQMNGPDALPVCISRSLPVILDSNGYERSEEGLAMRLLNINLGAINTSSVTFTHALLYLATHPEYAAILRAEVENVLDHEGQSKEGMQKMVHVDSFLRESAKLNAISLTSINRYTLDNYTFADGTFIPKGTVVASSMYSTHLDEKIYPNAHTFDPWRFVNSSGKSDTGKAYTVTSAEFLSFGAGKHVCPGRFFAANELKAMLAHIVITYDVKFEAKANGVRPPNEYVGTSVIPNTTAHVLFCRRV
ncbi:cytochrome P450 [Dendrothele bispora CBS 962.96]|uniref:Cytochrome P450 n=1 Tax=Dendrothele bispora (strain CBS 962.96) TaxID=1314807 RepID=A0A4S8L7S5_DENBC|nr:cytochrome P450 [Dendrothele bispora CBS 962.96]